MDGVLLLLLLLLYALGEPYLQKEEEEQEEQGDRKQGGKRNREDSVPYDQIHLLTLVLEQSQVVESIFRLDRLQADVQVLQSSIGLGVWHCLGLQFNEWLITRSDQRREQPSLQPILGHGKEFCCCCIRIENCFIFGINHQ
ncbi:hypothetical protein SDC9_68477 [bioreactor metagenome]|uniref:Uncharacterized protein n=1 Tax=bioreactor metagenome TaxID=1076179 RepID=A0A644Y1L8_9ZZZZ